MPETKPLYMIAEDHAAIADRIAEAGGEITPELEAEWERSGADLDAKFEACRHRLEQHERDAAAERGKVKYYAEKAAECREAESAAKNRAERLKSYMLSCLSTLGMKSFRTKNGWGFTAARNSRPKIRPLVPLESLPLEFVRIKSEFDSDAAYRAWKRGDLPESIEAVTGDHLRLS